ncbi:MAG: HEAT repeat domain-containing protein [Bryobacterales bacterium]|nr:HEAT repeat domain-containing protein [Bryobacterales bacterium]MDE0293600.1 HEAT repeat domain-containing protein [Bryobacterales bacterium]MDE0432990.1 HEAT repeat domain-containing protein [Bryobacterales bacterium]
MAELKTSPSSAPSRRATLIVTIVAAMFIIVPFLFWLDTWFGRELTDEEIREYLADQEKPRKAQHALVQISERMSAGDPSAEQWYPDIVELAGHSLAELRVTAAWVMGQGRESQAFHDTLLTLLDDDEPLVRRNAALSLAGFADPTGRPVLQSMLRPYTITSPHAGKLQNRLEPEDTVSQATLLARIEQTGAEEPAEIRSPVPGVVRERLLKDGSDVTVGDEIMVLDPDYDHVFQSLRALFLVGAEEDLEDVRRFLRPREGMPANVAQQARLTADEIRRRAAGS